MKRVLVAGATGYLGHFVCRELRARGYFVRALVRSPHKLDRLWDVTDEIVHGEVTKPETLNRVCENMDAVFSSVGITRQKDGLSFRDVDYQGNLNLLEEARRAGVRKFVYVSVLHGQDLTQLDIVKAHEDFVAELEKLAYEVDAQESGATGHQDAGLRRVLHDRALPLRRSRRQVSITKEAC